MFSAATRNACADIERIGFGLNSTEENSARFIVPLLGRSCSLLQDAESCGSAFAVQLLAGPSSAYEPVYMDGNANPTWLPKYLLLNMIVPVISPLYLEGFSAARVLPFGLSGASCGTEIRSLFGR